MDDVIDEERAVLFSNNDCPSIPCELQFQISPNFKIAAITLVCSAPKVEVFVGPTQEYLETVYGTSIEEQEADIPIRPYRYDVEIDRSGIAEINLKLLTSAKEICVYGAMLHVAPNPNGITTQQQKTFDIQKIQELLQKAEKANEADEKLQKFLYMMKGLSCPAQSNPLPPASAVDISPSVQQQIDEKFEQLQLTITKKLDEFEAQQTAKLDRIIAMLEKKN